MVVHFKTFNLKSKKMIILNSHCSSHFDVSWSLRVKNYRVRLVKAKIAPKLKRHKRLFKTIVIGEKGGEARTPSELNLLKPKGERFLRAGMS